MRANKRFIFTVAIIGCWTFLTYFIVIRNHSENSGKSKFREKIDILQKEIDEETQNRERIILQYKNLVNLVQKSKEATPTAAPIKAEENLIANSEESVNNIQQLNNKINFSGKYVEGDVNKPVIPVIVFACNRVSVSRNLDALIKYRPSRQQFPIIVSQVCSARPRKTNYFTLT